MDLEELKKTAQEATEGPWGAFGVVLKKTYEDSGDVGEMRGAAYGMNNSENFPSRCKMRANIKFMAAANPAVVLALIAEIEKLMDGTI